jgi:hypothetical protein
MDTLNVDLSQIAEKSPEQAFAQLQAWYQTRKQLAALKQSEVLTRIDIARYYFREPVEGTNRFPLGDGYDIKYDYKISRNVDEALLDANLKKLRQAKVPVDALFEYKPRLVMDQYRALTEEQRLLVDAVLDIKPGDTPQIDIVPTTSENEPPLQTMPTHAPLPAAAAPAPVHQLVMTPLADGVPIEDFYAKGWTNEQLIAHGFAVAIEPERLEPPKPKRGRRPGSKNKAAAT